MIRVFADIKLLLHLLRVDDTTKVDVTINSPDERTHRVCATLACAADKWRPLRLIHCVLHGLTRVFRMGGQGTKPVKPVLSCGREFALLTARLPRVN